MKNVSCQINLYNQQVNRLTSAMIKALEKTAEALHTEVAQSQNMPFETGNLQNESTFVDNSDVKEGIVYLSSSTPYARRLYYHPEYHFDKSENPNARGKWLNDWLVGGKEETFAQKTFNQIYKEDTGV